MDDTDSVMDALQPIRVTGHHTRMAILPFEAHDTSGGIGRLAYIGLLDPTEPITVADLTRSTGILSGFTGVLGTIAFAVSSFEGWYPELVFRPPAPPLAGYADVYPDRTHPSKETSSVLEPQTEPEPSGRTDRQPRATASGGKRPPMPVAGHRSLRTVSRMPKPASPDPWPSDPMRVGTVQSRRVQSRRVQRRADRVIRERVRPSDERPADVSESSPIDQPSVPEPPSVTPALPPEQEAGETVGGIEAGDGTQGLSSVDRSTEGPSERVQSADELVGKAEAGPEILDERRVNRSESPRPSWTTPSTTGLVRLHESLTLAGFSAKNTRRRQSSVAHSTSTPRTRSTSVPRITSPTREHAGSAFWFGSSRARDRDRAGGTGLAGRQVPLTVQRRLARPGRETDVTGGASRQRYAREPPPPTPGLDTRADDSEIVSSPEKTHAIGAQTSVVHPIDRHVPLTVYRRLSGFQREEGRAQDRTGNRRMPRETRPPRQEFQSAAMPGDTTRRAVPSSGAQPGDVDVDHLQVDQQSRSALSMIGPRRPGLVPSALPPDRPKPQVTLRSFESALDRAVGGGSEANLDEQPVSSILTTGTGGELGRAKGGEAVDTGEAGVWRFPVVSAPEIPVRGRKLSKVPTNRSRDMPTLSMRDNGDGRPPLGEGDHRRSSMSASDIGVQREARADEPTDPERDSSRRHEVREPRIQPTVFGRKPAPTRGDRTARRDDPPSGRDTSTRYSDFSFETLAPRIDVTHRADTSGGQTPSGELGDDRRDRTSTAGGIEDLLAAGDFERATSPAEVDYLVEKLKRGLERKRRIDRERRGL